MTDTDKTEAPVTNEELYVEIQSVYRTIVLALAGVFATSMGLASALDDLLLTAITAVGAISLLLLHTAWGSRNILTSGFEWLVNEEVETIDELDARLTDGARADGSGGNQP
jgi:hypothetical protein